MTDYKDADVAEVQSLRGEITARIGLMNALVGIELAAVGTALTVLPDSSTHVLAGLAAISSFLWLLWMDQTASIYKIAAYLAIEMAPRLESSSGRRALRWEKFLRSVEAGGQEAANALFRGSPPPSSSVVRHIRADWYVPLLFGLTPPLLLTLYVKADVHRADPAIMGLACLAGAVLWIFAVTRFAKFVGITKVIDEAILAADTGAEPSGA